VEVSELCHQDIQRHLDHENMGGPELSKQANLNDLV